MSSPANTKGMDSITFLLKQQTNTTPMLQVEFHKFS